jgi:hypothetical protein
MKTTGELYTIKGQFESGTTGNKIQLFDGRFDTGYKVMSFAVAPDDPTRAQEIMAKIITEDTASFTGADWDWSDNEQLAWAYWGSSTSGLSATDPFIDPDNLIIEDLYLQGYTTGEATTVNYLIKLQKYDINDWQGALAMVRNRSQQ